MPSQPPQIPKRSKTNPQIGSGASPTLPATQSANSGEASTRRTEIWYLILIVGVIVLLILMLIAGGIGVGIAIRAFSPHEKPSVTQPSSAGEAEIDRKAKEPKRDSDSKSLPEENSAAPAEAEEEPPGMTAEPKQTPAEESPRTDGDAPAKSSGGKKAPSDVSADAPVITIPGGGFFGIVVKGKKFVYVVDCSGSMIGLPLTRAKQEVMRSIRALSEDQAYSIIFFASESFSMYHPEIASGLEKPTQETLEKTQAWVDGFPVSGGTEPLGALRQALKLEPDVIFLLTDGEFGASVAPVVVYENVNKVSINTVCFITRAGEPILKKIAHENNGDYRFVP